MSATRKYIAIINCLKNFISIFFSLFFNIYILKMVNNDINFIIKYTLFGVVIEIIICYIILNIINSKNARIIYKSSFVLAVINIFLLLYFKESIIKYILLFKVLERTRAMCYSVPYELLVIGANNDKNMSSFMANVNILSNISTILAPILSGFIIDKLSYYMLFVFLIIETIVILIISTRITDFTVNDKKLELKKFWNKAKSKVNLQNIYKCMFYRRISSQGAMTELLPIILFLRLGKELDLGAYNSLFAILSIASLQVLKFINHKNITKSFYPYLAMIIFLSSLFVVYNSSFTTLIIYYILMNTFGTIIETESCSMIYSAIKTDNLEEYKKEHIFTFNLYMMAGQIISYCLVYILYNKFYNVNILSIAVSVLMFFLIISTVYLTRTEKYLKTNQ